MKCPYCYNEMKKGQIETDEGFVKWQPVLRKRRIYSNFYRGDYENTIYFGKGNILMGGNAIAYYCEHCKVMIVYDGRKNP